MLPAAKGSLLVAAAKEKPENWSLRKISCYHLCTFLCFKYFCVHVYVFVSYTCLCLLCVCVFYVSASSICLCLLLKHFLSTVCSVSCPTRWSSWDQGNTAKRCATVCYGASDHPAEESAQEAAHSTLGNIDVIYQYWCWYNILILIQYININIDVY